MADAKKLPHESPQAAAEGFVIIPKHILSRTDISYAEKIIYGRVLALMQNSSGCCWANNEYIARTSGVRVRTVERAIPHLADLGLVALEGGGSRGRRIFPTNSAEMAELLRQNMQGLLRQNGDPTPPKGRSSSRKEEELHTDVENTATNSRIAERVLEYHHDLRIKIAPRSKPAAGRPRIQVLRMIASLLSEGRDEEWLRACCRGHLSDEWWVAKKKLHPKHAFTDPVRAEEFADASVEPPPDPDDYFGDESYQDHEGQWEGLPTASEATGA